MRKLLAALALLLALELPAQAVGITIINGGGTGGSIASNTQNTGVGLTITSSASTVDIPIGSLVHIGIWLRALVVYTGCTDTAGNTIPLPSQKGASSGGLVGSGGFITTIDEPIGTTWTCTSTSTAAKGINVTAFAAVASATPDTAGFPVTTAAGTNGGTTAISIGPSGTWTCPGGTNCSLQIVSWGNSVNPSVTEASGFTTLANLNTNNGFLHEAYQIVSVTTATTYAVTNATAGNWAGILMGFASTSGGAAPVCTLGTLGVGSC